MNNFNNVNIDSYRCSRVLTSQTDEFLQIPTFKHGRNSKSKRTLIANYVSS